MLVTRFAPSPTGFLHIGGARTALFNWLYAKHTGGKFLLRIEDTDRARSTKEAIDAIINSMKWLGLDWDDDIVLQSTRMERHKEVALSLIESGHAYFCYASQEEIAKFKEENPHQKFLSPWRNGAPPRKSVTPVVRIKAANEGVSSVKDNLQGDVTISNTQLDDMILLRSDGTPTYMLAVVVDDHDMGVTTVIRGDDHFNNAFRQNQIYDATGWAKPEYTHIPLIHGADGNKLSKRHGATGVEEYKHMGYLPQALLNYLLRLGWSHGDDEIIPIEKAIEWFDLSNLGKSPSRFDFDKLNYINSHYIKNLDNKDIMDLIKDSFPQVDDDVYSRLYNGISLVKERVSTLTQLSSELMIFIKRNDELSNEAKDLILSTDKTLLNDLIDVLESLDEWSSEKISATCKSFALNRDVKMHIIMHILRAFITGSIHGASITDVVSILGKSETLKRLKDVEI